MSLFYALVTICLFGNTLAQVPGIGPCPDVTTQANFDVSQYTGVWYEQYRYFAVFELGAKCVIANYTSGPNNTITVVNSNINALTGKPASIQGSASTPNASEPAKLEVEFEGVPAKGNYWVLGTDYENYSVVYSCNNFKIFHVTFSWLLTRNQNATESVLDEAFNIAKNNDVNTRLYMRTNQEDC